MYERLREKWCNKHLTPKKIIDAALLELQGKYNHADLTALNKLLYKWSVP